jgi:hypothetical protein
MADQIYMTTNCHFPQKLTISILVFQLNFNFGQCRPNKLAFHVSWEAK